MNAGEEKRSGEEEAPERQLVAAAGLPVARGYGAVGAYGSTAPTDPDSFVVKAYEYWRVLRRYKWLILSITLAFLAIGGVRTLLTTPLYTATVRLQIDRNVTKILNEGNTTPFETGDSEFLRTQYELIEGRDIAERVVSTLNLADDPSFVGGQGTSLMGLVSRLLSRREAGQGADRAAIEKAATSKILANRTVVPVVGSRLVEINYTDSVPSRAQAIAMGLANAFIGANLDKRFEANAYAKSFLEDQLQQAQSRLQDSEKAQLDFGEKEQIISTNDKSSVAENNLNAANAALSSLISDRIKNEQLYKQVASVDAATFPQFLSNTVIEGLRVTRNALVTDYQNKLATYKPSYPAMIQINNQIKETDRQIATEIATVKSSLKGAYEASVSQEAEMRHQIDNLRAEVLDLQKRGIQYNILKRQADSNRALYDGLLQRYKEVDVAGGIGANNIFIVDKAEVPGSPSSPLVLRDTLISLLLGLIAGIATAVTVDRLDNTVTTLDEIERLTGLSTLGIVPKIKADRQLEAELDDFRSGVSESYRTLCTSLHFATDNGLPKSLLFTSSIPGEGKSTSSLMVAKHFANTGMRVLLIDGDLRKPALHSKLKLPSVKGLTNYLTGSLSLPETMQKTATDNLIFMSSGPLPPNAADLLASPRLLSLLTASNEFFDLVIFDGPPLMGLADAQLLSNAVSATVFIVRAGHTSKNSIRAALKRLHWAKTHVIGTVLTHHDVKNESYAYDYGYGYGYGYGHSNSENAKLENGTKTDENVST